MEIKLFLAQKPEVLSKGDGITLIVPLNKAFSASARAAAAAARRRARLSGVAKEYANAKSGGEEGTTPGQRKGPDPKQAPKKSEQAPKKSYQNYDDPTLTENTKRSTKVSSTMETDATRRMKVPNTKGESVPTHQRPLDYGHARELIQEKYGNKRGARMYDSMVDGPSARIFQAGTKIVAEKRAMMFHLGKEGSPASHHYQGLHYQWLKAQ